jgi:hypothetical protein
MYVTVSAEWSTDKVQFGGHLVIQLPLAPALS